MLGAFVAMLDSSSSTGMLTCAGIWPRPGIDMANYIDCGVEP